MDLMTLFVLALGLSMDAFAVSISNTMCFSGLRRSQCAAASLSFGLFQGLMPTIGFFAGRAFAGVISSVDHWVAFLLLGFIGGNMVREAVQEMRQPPECPVQRDYTFRMMMAQAVATSIDALAVGVTFGMEPDVQIIPSALLIGATTFVISFSGVIIGNVFGARWKDKAQIVGGVMLILVGLKILLEGLGVFHLGF